MKNGINTSKDNPLRQSAEKRLGRKKTKDLPQLSPAEAQKLIHELQVHQVELVIQNEELHRVMTELTASTAKYADFYEFTPVGYLTLDEEGRILESNLTAATILGLERSRLQGNLLQLIVHLESLPALRLFLAKVFSEGHKQSCELKLLKKGADSVFIDLEGLTVDHPANGAVKQCRAVMIDITKRKLAEKQLESFSYSVSHDLREPLRAIDGYSRMLLRDLKGKLDDEAQRKFNVIREKAGKMDRLINDLLEFSRLGKGKITAKVIDLEKLATEIWEELRENQAERDITMKIYPSPVCYGDEKLIRQVLANLLANAVKFSRGKEPVTIEAGGYESAAECIYYVKDNGIGFDMHYSDKLWQMWGRLHIEAEYEGTGVGLTIVKRIIELHGGRVWAEGKVGEGAIFYFALPKQNPC